MGVLHLKINTNCATSKNISQTQLIFEDFCSFIATANRLFKTGSQYIEVYISDGSIFTSYKALPVKEWMSVLASLGKILGMGIFLGLLRKNMNMKNQFLVPDGNLKHGKLEIFVRITA